MGCVEDLFRNEVDKSFGSIVVLQVDRSSFPASNPVGSGLRCTPVWVNETRSSINSIFLIYEVENFVLIWVVGLWAPDVHMISAMAAQNCI